MFDFGVGYIYRLYKQIKNIYQIKTHIDIIYDSFNKNNSEIKQKENFESLKQIIFSCGSLYIKFFQWYISKLKSNTINNDILTQNDTQNNTQNDTQNDILNNTQNDTQSKYLLSFITYFEDIFEQCPYHDIEHTKKIFIESMYGIALEKYVDMNTFTVIASGSIGQVYYAKKLNDGSEVAIKVKHPNIEKDLENQYEIIKFIKLIQMIPFFRNRYNMYFNVDDFLSDINLQCDFNNEANNCIQFQENFKDSSDYIVFPKIIYQSKDLLISEFIEGDSFENLTNVQKSQTSINFICFFYQMLLVDNFLHGDLHCKNWKVRVNNNNNNNNNKKVQLIIYDCGICFQNINTELTNDFWFSLLKYDIDGITKAIKLFISDNNINNVNNVNNENNENNEKFKMDINNFFNSIIFNSIDTSILIKSIINFFRANDIIVPKFLLNLSILICVIEEFLKANNIIDKEKYKQNNTTKSKSNMFEIMNDCQMDIIAFCDVKKCYPKVRDLFTKNMEDKYIKYKYNIEKNNIMESNTIEKRLFSSLSLSNLKFRKPE